MNSSCSCTCSWCQYYWLNSKNCCSRYENEAEQCPKYYSEDDLLKGNKMITINKSETADSRTCDYKSVSKETLRNSTLSHIGDVRKTMQFFANLIVSQSREHDSHKLYTIDWFYDTFKNGFENKGWYNDHKKDTRHHLKDNPYLMDDVNLVDVFEYICDCVCAGLSRSGNVYDLDIDEKILVKAFNNTVEMLKKNIVVKD